MNTKNLEKFRKILQEKKEQLLNNIEHNIKEMESLKHSGISDEADLASASADNFTELAIARQQNNELKDIELALKKISKKTYGICEMCDEEIDTNRLEVKCYAKFCIDCREIYEKTSNKDKHEI
jgi:DnaK suppressor protein